ncbi:hypothetical protein JZ751_017475, partial [Albula glossodonta]
MMRNDPPRREAWSIFSQEDPRVKTEKGEGHLFTSKSVTQDWCDACNRQVSAEALKCRSRRSRASWLWSVLTQERKGLLPEGCERMVISQGQFNKHVASLCCGSSVQRGSTITSDQVSHNVGQLRCRAQLMLPGTFSGRCGKWAARWSCCCSLSLLLSFIKDSTSLERLVSFTWPNERIRWEFRLVTGGENQVFPCTAVCRATRDSRVSRETPHIFRVSSSPQSADTRGHHWRPRCEGRGESWSRADAAERGDAAPLRRRSSTMLQSGGCGRAAEKRGVRASERAGAVGRAVSGGGVCAAGGRGVSERSPKPTGGCDGGLRGASYASSPHCRATVPTPPPPRQCGTGAGAAAGPERGNGTGPAQIAAGVRRCLVSGMTPERRAEASATACFGQVSRRLSRLFRRLPKSRSWSEGLRLIRRSSSSSSLVLSDDGAPQKHLKV